MEYIKIDNSNYEDIVTKMIQEIDNAPKYTDTKTGIGNTWRRVPMFFDTETSDVTTIDKDGNDVKYSFVYISQLGVGSLKTYCRNFNMMLDAIMEIAVSLTENVRMGIHNTSFDWSFMANYMVNMAGKCGLTVEALLNKPHAPIVVTITNREGAVLQIVDTALIFNASLETVGKKYTNSQKLVGFLNYKKCRNSVTPLTKDELDYCMYDIIVGMEAMEYLYKKFSDNGEQFPITSTSMVRHKLAGNYCEFNNNPEYQEEHKEFLKIAPPSKNDKNNLVNFQAYFPYSYEQYKAEFIDYLFRGGFTHGNVYHAGKVVHNVTCADFTSSYPAVMFQKSFPIGTWKRVFKNNLHNFNDGHEIYYIGKDGKMSLIESPYHFKMTVTFKNLVSTTNHSLESESKAMNELDKYGTTIDNGKISSTNELKVMITELDYANYCRAYTWDELIVEEMFYAESGRLPQYLIDTMVEPYLAKAELKANKQPYDHEKALVNSTYGMCVQRLNLTSYKIKITENNEIDTNTSDFDEKTIIKCKKKINAICDKWEHNTGTTLPRREVLDKYGDFMEVYDIEEIRKMEYISAQINKELTTMAYCDATRNKMLSPYWGLYISAWARYNLVQTLFDIEEVEPNAVVYYDTDSLYIKDIEKVQHILDKYNDRIHQTNKELGADEKMWDLGEFDKDPVCHRFKHLGAKRYIKEMDEIKDKKPTGRKVIKSTIAGLKKNWFTKYASYVDRFTTKNGNDTCFEVFTHGFTVNKMLTSKLCSQYFSDVISLNVTDYLGNTNLETVQGGVTLSEVPFSMIITESYRQLMEKFKK